MRERGKESCEKPEVGEGIETSFCHRKDAVAAVLGTIRQVITQDDSVLGKLNWLFIKSMYLGMYRGVRGVSQSP